MPWQELLNGAFLVAIVAAFLTSWLQRRDERRRAEEDLLFRVYMALLELKGMHFWTASAEARGERPPDEVVKRFNDIRWRIADDLRRLDGLPELEATLRVMFLVQYPSERERSDALQVVIDRLGKRVNPRYNRFVREISEENMAHLAADPRIYMERLACLQTTTL